MNGIKTGGRVKGTPNRSTRELREMLRSVVDFEQLALKLVDLANDGNLRAITLLFELAYGRPVGIKEVQQDEEFEKELSV